MSPLFKSLHFTIDPVRHMPACNDPSSVLHRWDDPGTEIALWERQTPSFAAGLDGLAFDKLPHARFVTRAQHAGSDIGSALTRTPLTDGALRDALAADIENLIVRFANITGARTISVRLEAIANDACRLFHIDRTKARLVTTYIGPGTEWVTRQHGEEAIRLQDRYDGPIFRMPRFAVGLFPGSLSPSGGLTHRSPRISRSREFRLLLCLNEPLGTSVAAH
jgi:hypothetical protein